MNPGKTNTSTMLPHMSAYVISKLKVSDTSRTYTFGKNPTCKIIKSLVLVTWKIIEFTINNVIQIINSI